MSPPKNPPGITISEPPSGTHPIAGVPTGIAAFVGWAAQGPTDQAILVRSWSDFAQQFGDFDPRFYLGYAVSHFFANGGQQAYIVRLASDGSGGNAAAASAAVMTGVHLLDAVPIFNLLAVPGEADPDLIGQLQAYCAGRKTFLIVDSAPDSTFATLQNGPDSRMTGANARNSALYFPWLNALDAKQNVTRPFPPSGFVAGLYAATDARHGVWYAPAGTTAPLTGALDPVLKLTDADSAVLNPHAVNCIRIFPQFGDVVWGARTLAGSDQADSDWTYVPVRRLALYIETSVRDGTKWATFEPNDARLWSELNRSIGAFMQALFAQGAFKGQSAAESYFVQCDAQNNPPSGIDQGIVNITIGFAPVKPAEFVIIQIQQIAGQTGGAGQPPR
jgi:phage tail sheath protein FI